MYRLKQLSYLQKFCVGVKWVTNWHFSMWIRQFDLPNTLFHNLIIHRRKKDFKIISLKKTPHSDWKANWIKQFMLFSFIHIFEYLNFIFKLKSLCNNHFCNALHTWFLLNIVKAKLNFYKLLFSSSVCFQRWRSKSNEKLPTFLSGGGPKGLNLVILFIAAM